MSERLNIRVLDVNHADLFEPGAEGVRIALTDMSYDGRDHTQAMRQRAKRLAGANTSRVVARWSWYGCPAVSVVVTGCSRNPWKALEM